MPDNDPNRPVLALTAQIVSAHVAHNSVSVEGLPTLIQRVYQALTNAGAEQPAAPERPPPAVSPKRSVFPDHIVCLEDGKKFKTLKRHLQIDHHMTPAQYRERWGLPADYPMVSPAYAEHRSSLAKQIGLGRKREDASAEPAQEAAPESDPEPAPTPSRRRRKSARTGSDGEPA